MHRKPFIYFCIPVIVKAKADLFNEFNVGPPGRDVGAPCLTYHGDCAEGHDQRKRGEGVGGKHAELTQQHQE